MITSSYTLSQDSVFFKTRFPYVLLDGLELRDPSDLALQVLGLKARPPWPTQDSVSIRGSHHFGTTVKLEDSNDSSRLRK